MEVLIIIVLVVQGCISGFFCAYIAKEKGRGASDWFILGFFFSLLAVLALIALPKVEPDRPAGPNSSGSSSPAATPVGGASQLFNGPRDLKSSNYQLFLSRRFVIERSNTLDKFVIGDQVYDNLTDALEVADRRYGIYLAELAARDREREQQARQRVEEQKRQLAEEAELAEWWKQNFRKAAPWLITGCFAFVIIGLAVKYQDHAKSAVPCSDDAAPWKLQPTLEGGVLRQCPSGFSWRESDNGNNLDFTQAQAYCQGLGSGNWSLPTSEQLKSLYRADLQGNVCGVGSCRVSGLLKLSDFRFWTADRNGPSDAWTINLMNGNQDSYQVTYASIRALCVRQ